MISVYIRKFDELIQICLKLKKLGAINNFVIYVCLYNQYIAWSTHLLARLGQNYITNKSQAENDVRLESVGSRDNSINRLLFSIGKKSSYTTIVQDLYGLNGLDYITKAWRLVKLVFINKPSCIGSIRSPTNNDLHWQNQIDND